MKTITTVEAIQPNVSDVRYLRSEHLINKALEVALTERRINIRPTEICRTAIITSPTFYAHCANSDEALRKYESSLLNRFAVKLVDKGENPEIIFTILLSFIRTEKGYFKATLPNYNYWLLHQLFQALKSVISYQLDDSHYDYYIHKLTAIIVDWAKQDKFSLKHLPRRVNEMLLVEF